MHHHLQHVQNVMQEHILVQTKLYMVLLIVVADVLQELIVPLEQVHVHNVELIHLVQQVLYHVQVVLQDITALQVLQVVQNVLLENHVQMVSLLIVVLVNIVQKALNIVLIL
jgi:hypothetical protein